jgi:hypothetical protein
MNTKEKIKAALMKKEEGSALFRTKKFAGASKKFEKVIRFTLICFTSSTSMHSFL